MTANAARRPRDRSTRSPGEGSFRCAVPMAGTGDGPRPDPTTLTLASRAADERRAAPDRAAPNRTAADDTTQ